MEITPRFQKLSYPLLSRLASFLIKPGKRRKKSSIKTSGIPPTRPLELTRQKLVIKKEEEEKGRI